MTHAEVIRSISKRLERKRNDQIVRAYLTQVMEAAWRDGAFTIPDFLMLRVRTDAGRVTRNPSTKELMQLPAQKRLKARVSKVWRTRP